MNEFTKDELYHILDWSKELGSEYGTEGDAMDIHVTNKIKSLIDNYCDHKNTTMDCDGGISMVCHDCGKTTMDI